MIPRSYIKIKELPQKKDMLPCHGVGLEFKEHEKENKELIQLGNYGQTLISKFTKENEHRINELRTKEETIWKLFHSPRRPPIEWNNWKPTVNRIEEFMKVEPDKIQKNSKEEEKIKQIKDKKEYLIQAPWRIPKKDGTYFDKTIPDCA